MSDVETRVEALQSELARTQDELRRSREEFERFGSVASHDLAQPLQVAFGYLEMVRSEFGDTIDPSAAQWVGAASNSLEKMRRLVHEIMVFSRTGKTELVKTTVDLGVVTELALGAEAPLIDERHAEIEIVHLPQVSGSERELTLVVQHLVANAVRFTAPGVTPRVRISADAADGGVTVSVDDNGPGIPDDLHDGVFEAFQRARRTDKSGNGLGLATCRRILIRHGGRIWIESSTLGGSRFRFFLPSALT